jgi:hypothetical protein
MNAAVRAYPEKSNIVHKTSRDALSVLDDVHKADYYSTMQT